MKRGGFIWFQTPVTAADLVPILFDKGLSMQKTVERLQDRFPETTVASCWTRCFLQSGNRRAYKKPLPFVDRVNPLPAVRAFPVLVASAKPVQMQRIGDVPRLAVHILHLLDLKRAGHSPRDTELDISTDTGKPLRITAPASISFITSSAAMAAELGA